MPNGSAAIVQKLWNYCNVLRDAGLSYQDYIEQLTYLLFLKMADERKKLQPEKAPHIPGGYDWPSLLEPEGDALDIHYRKILETLGRESGMLGTIFRKAQSKIQNPALLRRLIVDLIDREQWMTLDVDVKGDAYEGFAPQRIVGIDDEHRAIARLLEGPNVFISSRNWVLGSDWVGLQAIIGR